MVTNLHIGIDGRLGNQLFQYAALKSLCINNGYECTLPPLTAREWHGQDCLLDKFNLNCTVSDNFLKLQYYYEEPDIATYDDTFFQLPDNTSIRGFFQNIKYFESCKDILIRELKPKLDIYSKAKNIIDGYRKKYPNYELISIHIRRGDNITVNVDFGIEMFGRDITLDPDSIWGKYFIKAKEVFKNKKVKYLLFTGGSRDNNDSNDHDWLKANFSTDEYIHASIGDALIDYSLISLCDHNILCHATSYGWWAAYVNENPNKIMVIPEKYFLDNNDTRLYNSDFIII